MFKGNSVTTIGKYLEHLLETLAMKSAASLTAPFAIVEVLEPNTIRTDRFRQTRFQNTLKRVRIRLQSGDAELQNWSRTGSGFEVPADSKRYEVDEMIPAITVLVGEVVLYDGSVRVRYVKPGDGKIYYGVECREKLFLNEAVDTAMAVTDCVSGLVSDASKVREVNPEFARLTLALILSLNSLRTACDAEEAKLANLPLNKKLEAEKVYLTNMSVQIRALFIDFNVQIAEHVQIEELPEGSIYHKLFRELVYPYFKGADLVRRAFEKPRGYAGDYEMMNQIYRQGFEGNTIFGRLLHNYIANENSGHSVRFRREYFISQFEKLMVEKPGQELSFISVASGPAVEVQEAIKKWSPEQLERASFTLFDLDREALEHAQTHIFDIAVEYKKSPSVRFVNASVRAFLKMAADFPEKYDLIYSGGLFDYLDNATSAALVRKFVGMLNPGGRVIIGNFTKNNLTKAYLHLLTDWALIHKSEAEMLQWAEGVEGAEVTVDYDPNQMNAFLVVRKK